MAKKIKDILNRNNEEEIIDVEGKEMSTEPKKNSGIVKKVLGGIALTAVGALAGYGLSKRHSKGSDSYDDTYDETEDVSEADFDA